MDSTQERGTRNHSLPTRTGMFSVTTRIGVVGGVVLVSALLIGATDDGGGKRRIDARVAERNLSTDALRGVAPDRPILLRGVPRDALRAIPEEISKEAARRFNAEDAGTTAGLSAMVYQNASTFENFQPPGAQVLIADDMWLKTATNERELGRIEKVCVFSPDGTGPFDVTIELWTDDGTSVAPAAPIPGASCAAFGLASGTIWDAGLVAECAFGPGSGIKLPEVVWMVLTFSTDDAGWVIGGDAESGLTDDFFWQDPPGELFWFGEDLWAGLCGELWADKQQECSKIAPAGQDCWSTACGGTRYDFANTPIPADFFGSGSDPFTGAVQLQGFGGPGAPDTYLERKEDMCFDEPGVPQATSLRLLLMDLISCQPITVTYNGGQNPEQWNVDVFLDGPQQQGTLTATKTDAEGGFFDSTLIIQPGFTFVRKPDGMHLQLLPGVKQQLTATQIRWWQVRPPFGTCGPGGFFPGDFDPELQCCPESCHSSLGTAPHEHCVIPPECEPCPPVCRDDSDCDDGIDCTNDACQPTAPDADQFGCVNRANDTKCDDGVFCNGDETCDPDSGGCVALSACPPWMDGCVTRNGDCDEVNDVCVDVPDHSVCDAFATKCRPGLCDLATGACFTGDKTPPDCCESDAQCANFATKCRSGLCDPGTNACFTGAPAPDCCESDEECPGTICRPGVCDLNTCTTGEKLPDCCETNAQCPGTKCRQSFCDIPTNRCQFSQKAPDCCESDAQCGNFATMCRPGLCDPDTNTCFTGEKVPDCCETNAQCANGDACTTDFCDTTRGFCLSAKVETRADECCDPWTKQGSPEDIAGLGQITSIQDGDPCTRDSCSKPFGRGVPVHEPILCTSDALCADLAVGGHCDLDLGVCVCPPTTDEPCSICPKGLHWVDGCTGGVDNLRTGAVVGIDTDGDCREDLTVVLGGPARISRSDPMDWSPRSKIAGTDGHYDVIETEILSMSLVGEGVQLHAGRLAPTMTLLLPSLGAIEEQPTPHKELANSYFDVFFEVFGAGLPDLYNHEALRVEAKINCIPPRNLYFHPHMCLPLYDRPPGDPTATVIANLVTANHDPHPQCGSQAAGPCNEPHDAPYCKGRECCEDVCAIDRLCCDDQWYPECASIAQEICPAQCCLPDGRCLKTSKFDCEEQGGTVLDKGHCPSDGVCIPPGDDCFPTPEGRTQVSFAKNPIPAGFFGPTSQLFDGVIRLMGATRGLTDTIVRRLQPAAPNGTTATVDIEIVALSLKSVDPVPIVVNEGMPDEFWDVTVDLSPGPVPVGEMEITKTHENGGTYHAMFYLQPRFTFRRVGDPADVRVLDTALIGKDPVYLTTIGRPPWLHFVDDTVAGFACSSVNFVPGARVDPTTLRICCVPIGHAGPGHLHVTGQTCNPCPEGACCNTANGSCTMAQGAADCNGAYMGDGTDCRDSDGDGLADWFETNDCNNQKRNDCFTGTDPNNPDTDGDGLSDGDEVKFSKCDPCVPDAIDSDDDGITDTCGTQHFVKFSQPPKPGRSCTCNGDVDKDDLISNFDLITVTNCTQGECADCFNSCDVNCDGVVNEADIKAVHCMLGGNAQDECCTRNACSQDPSVNCETDADCAGKICIGGPVHGIACDPDDPNDACVIFGGSCPSSGVCVKAGSPIGGPPGEDYPSDLDWRDGRPNQVAADDFISDGRPVTAVRWWGSNARIEREIEVDFFPDSEMTFEINSLIPAWSETVTVIGPTTVEVDLGGLGDKQANGLEEVSTEIVSMELTGVSTNLGPIIVRLRPWTSNPFMRTVGQIEEKVNNTTDVLDIPPFTATGSASTYFDVFFEVEVAGGEVYHNLIPKHIETQITHKPPAQGEKYESPDAIPLYDENKVFTGITIKAGFHIPDPDPKACDDKGSLCGDPTRQECICETRPDGTTQCAEAADLNASPCPHGQCQVDADCEVPGTKCFIQPGLIGCCGHNCGEHAEKCAPPGPDCWTTLCDPENPTQFDFSQAPIPADFFFAGSPPFAGVVSFGGAGGGPDTIVQRLEEMCFPGPLPHAERIPIELTQLDLVSCEPITVNGFQFDVLVGLAGPQQVGDMTATKTHPNGGTFTFNLPVHAQFTFQPTGGGPIVGPPLKAPLTVFQTITPSPWLQTGGISVCGAEGFFSGWEERGGEPCCQPNCHAGTGGHMHCTYPPNCPPCDKKICDGKGTSCGPGTQECICETRPDGTLNCADANDFISETHGYCPSESDSECEAQSPGTKCFVNAPVAVCAHNCGEHEDEDPKACTGKGSQCGDPTQECICETRAFEDPDLTQCAEERDLMLPCAHGECAVDADCVNAPGTKCFGQTGAGGCCAHNCGEEPVDPKACDTPGDSPFCDAVSSPCGASPNDPCHCGRHAPTGTEFDGPGICVDSLEFDPCGIVPCGDFGGDQFCQAMVPGTKCVFDECCGWVCVHNCPDTEPQDGLGGVAGGLNGTVVPPEELRAIISDATRPSGSRDQSEATGAVAAGTVAGTPGADVQLGGSREPTIAVDPNNSQNIAAASLFRLRVSTDGGTTWQPEVIPTVDANAGRCGDPSLTYDSQGRLFWTYLGCVNDDNGNTIGMDIYIAQCNPATGVFLAGYPVNVTASPGISMPAKSGFTHDKEWVVADAWPSSPFVDRLHLVWTEFPPGGGLTVVRAAYSTDQGASWTWSTNAALSRSLSTFVEGFVWPAHNTVAPNGDVYIAYHSQPGWANPGACRSHPNGVSGQVVVVRSTNGGGTYAQKTLAYTAGRADMTFNTQTSAATIPQTDFWLQGSVQPWMLADPNTPGRIYVVANDDPDNNPLAGDPANVFIAISTNDGLNWGVPQRIDGGPGVTFQVMPTAAIDRDSGCIAVHYYDNRNGAKNANGNFLLDVYYTVSSDQGLSFSPDVRINDNPFDPDFGASCRFDCDASWTFCPNKGLANVPTLRIGEYNGVAFANGNIHADWCGNSAGGHQTIYDNVLDVCEKKTESRIVPDGWLISFHEHLQKSAVGDAKEAPLALYYCDTKVVRIDPTELPDCQEHEVFEYFVNLDDCCLLHSSEDSRTLHMPALKNGFYEEKGVDYNIDIQAVIGATFWRDKETGECIKKRTDAPPVDGHFWGWHTTGNNRYRKTALQTTVRMGPPEDWLYGPWSNIEPKCELPNMAFELLTDVPTPICKEQCCQCGGGPHWIDDCAPGTDRMKSGALVGIDLDGDCVAESSVVMGGPVYVEKSGPLDDSVHFPGTRAIDGHDDVIDTEITNMRLSSRDGIVLTAGAKYGLHPTYGVIAEQAEDPNKEWADSFFDVFFAVDLDGDGADDAFNQRPLRLEAKINCVPPKARYFHPTLCPPLPLYATKKPVANQVPVAHLVTANHEPFAEWACCLPDQSCAILPPDRCMAAGGTSHGPDSECLGVEACCLRDGTCEEIDALCCLGKDGTPQGPNSVCTDDCDRCKVPGDMNGDGRVTLKDWALFEPCLSAGGPANPVALSCQSADINCDGVVDMKDVQLFQQLFEG